MVTVYVIGVPTAVVVLAGTKASLAGAPAVTVKVAVALVIPAAVAVMVAVPVVVGAKLHVAIPALATIGDGGVNEPETPLTENVIAFVAVVTVLPAAS
jgi:hypothetical protein